MQCGILGWILEAEETMEKAINTTKAWSLVNDNVRMLILTNVDVDDWQNC